MAATGHHRGVRPRGNHHSDDIAIGDPIRYRLRVEDPGQPRRVRFLHVLQGADSGAALSAPAAVTSSAGAELTVRAAAGASHHADPGGILDVTIG